MGDPLQALADGGVLAVITAVEGPHYRRPGAIMAFPGSGGATGQLSSGCIEADLALHAARLWEDAIRTGTGARAVRLRYGAGSPFLDLVLPCGGGLEVTLLAVTDPAPLRAALAARDARRASALVIDPDRGCVTADGPVPPGGLRLPVVPAVRFVTFGTGIEAVTFARLAHAAGYGIDLLTHDPGTADAARGRGIAVRDTGAGTGEDMARGADPWTAVVLFYHDHDREPPVLAAALGTPAFYVGAQGSLRSHQARLAALQAMGVAKDAVARLRGPIGLIPSARDPQVLAVSVLAEILAESAARAGQERGWPVRT